MSLFLWFVLWHGLQIRAIGIKKHFKEVNEKLFSYLEFTSIWNKLTVALS